MFVSNKLLTQSFFRPKRGKAKRSSSVSNPTKIVTSILDEIIGKAVGERAIKLLDKIFCNFCGSHFNGINSICTHLSRIHKTSTFKCIVCSSVFTQPAQLRVHFAEHEEQARAAAVKNCDSFVIFCEKCGKGFKDINELFSLHSEEHAYDRIPCSDCDSSFHTTKFLIFHYQKKHLIENRVCIKCKHCPGEFVTTEAFKKHTRKEHANAKVIYSCFFCNFTHEVVSDFKDHLLLEHYNDKVYKCPASRCHYKTKKEKQYKNHIKSQHPNLEKQRQANDKNKKKNSGPAVGGSKSGTNVRNPQRGTKLVRNPSTTPGNRSQRGVGGQRPDPSGQGPTDSKTMYCKCCDKPFTNKIRLRVHTLAQRRRFRKLRDVNNGPEKSTPGTSAPTGRSGNQNRQDGQSRRLDCSVCKRSFNNNKSLLDHNRSEGHLSNISPRGEIRRSRPPQFQNVKTQGQNQFGTNTPTQQDVTMLVQSVLQQVLLANKPQEGLPMGNIPSDFTAPQRVNLWDNNQVGRRSNNLEQYNVPISNQRTSKRKRNSGQRQNFGGPNRNRDNNEMQRGFTSAERRRRGPFQDRNTFGSDLFSHDQNLGRSFSNTQSNSFGFANSGQGRSSLNQGRNSFDMGQARSSEIGYTYPAFPNSGQMDTREQYRY